MEIYIGGIRLNLAISALEFTLEYQCEVDPIQHASPVAVPSNGASTTAIVFCFLHSRVHAIGKTADAVIMPIEVYQIVRLHIIISRNRTHNDEVYADRCSRNASSDTSTD